MREGYCLVSTMLCDGFVDGSLGKAIDCVVSAEYSIK